MMQLLLSLDEARPMLGKFELLDEIASVNRGISASETDRIAIQAAATQLEGRNPTANPLDAKALLEGDWQLLYTTSQELLNIDRLPLATLGPIYQCIRLAEGRIYNIAEVNGPPLLSGLVTVAARLEPGVAPPRECEVSAGSRGSAISPGLSASQSVHQQTTMQREVAPMAGFRLFD
jgi:hypothetical protein